MVTYRTVPGFPAYRVGDDGSVWSCQRIEGFGNGGGSRSVLCDVWQQLDPSAPCHRYLAVWLCRDGKPHRRLIHSLVLATFGTPRPPGQVCRHLDGNNRNNALSNLAWGTHAQNAADKLRHGTQSRGEKHGKAKLTDALVVEILARLAQGETQPAVARHYGVCVETIGNIARVKTWTHIPRPAAA